MIRLLVFVLSFCMATVAASAGCTSGLFAALSTATLNQNYTELATGSLTYKNSVERKVQFRAETIFRKAGQLIQTAKSDIYVQTWHFDTKSDLAKNFAVDLAKLAQRRRAAGASKPVHVWLMANIFGLENAGHEQKKFEKFFDDYHLDSQYVALHIGIFDAVLLATNHAKTFSIDNKVAIVTGANFTRQFTGINQFDLGFVVRGQIVNEINRDFAQVWHRHVKSELAPKLVEQQNYQRGTGNCLPIMFARNNPYPNVSRTIRKSSMNQALLNSVRLAKTSVDIMTPNLNVKALREVIVEAVKANVRVRIILSKGFLDILENFPSRGGENLMNSTRLYVALGGFATRAHFCNLLQVRWYSDDGRDAVKGLKRPNSHAKFMIIDGQVSYFGSANMDNQSWVNSREVGLFVDNQSLAKSWTKQVFEPNFAKATLVRECGGPLEPITVKAMANK